MGIGLSPFLLCLSSTLLVQYYRKQFIHIFTFAYMDDLVGGCKNPTHLHAAVHRTVHHLLSLGVSISKDKRKFSGKYLYLLTGKIWNFT